MTKMQINRHIVDLIYMHMLPMTQAFVMILTRGNFSEVKINVHAWSKIVSEP